MGPSDRAHRAERGSVAVVGAASLMGLAVIAGAAMEIGRLQVAKNTLQDATDAGALHAAKLAVRGLSDDEVDAGARLIVHSDVAGPAGSAPSVTATVLARNPVKVEVGSTSTLPLVFGGALGLSAAGVTGHAVAEAKQDPLCLLLLDPSASRAWTAGGSSRVVGRGCGAHVNSTSSTALQSNGGAGADMLAINVGGPHGAANGFHPGVSANQPAMEDPIAPRITWPSSAKCSPSRTNLTVITAQLLPRGDYCGGLTVASGGVATLGPGVHVIQSGDLQIKSGGRVLAPVGVTIVLLGDTSTVNILAGGAADIRAPITGAWKGLAIAQKPQSAERTSNMQGGGELLFDGIIYLPSQKLRLTGGGDMAVVGLRRVFVARKLETAGNGKVFVNGDPALLAENASIRLVE